MTTTPRLRDAKHRTSKEPFQLNEIPDDVIHKIAGHLIYLISTGRNDISGDDWGDALAAAVDGQHLTAPLGIVDVVYNGMAWSTKTVKHIGKTGLFNANKINLISGRCSPDYSYGITDPHLDIQKTGNAVLNIWNERVSIAQDQYSPIRTSVLVRSPDLLSYLIFEEENHRFITSHYEWRVNKNGNLQGFVKGSDLHMFTWQPHGSQFTIHTQIPASARKFQIKQPTIISKAAMLSSIGFDHSWVNILK